MTAKATWTWTTVAVGLFAFIYFFERHLHVAPSGPARVLPALRASAVTSVRVVPKGQLEIRADRTNGIWVLTKPVNSPAENTAINALVQALEHMTPATSITAQELKNIPEVNENYGFEPPQQSVMLQQGDQQTLLHIGIRTPLGDQFFLQVVGVGEVYVIDAGLLGLIPGHADQWRDPRLVDLGQFTFDRLLVTNSGKTWFELQRNPTNRLWRMILPGWETRADSETVEKALQRIQRLGAQRFVSDDPKADLDSFGLQTPELSLALAEGATNRVLLEFGRSPTNNSAQVYARRADQNALLTVSKELLGSWQYENFRDRHLVSLSSPISEIEVVTARDHFSLQVQTNGEWIVSPQGFRADKGSVDEFISRLSGLQVVDFVKDVVTDPDLPEKGLASPSAEYIFKTPVNIAGTVTNVRLTALDFGTNLEDKIFARRTDESSLYTVKLADVAALPAASWELRERRIWNFSENDVAGITIEQDGKTQGIDRRGTNSWSIRPGSVGMTRNDLAMDEVAHYMGQLAAAAWVGRAGENQAEYGFGTNVHRITVELKTGTKLSVTFGAQAPSGFPYAMTTVDNEPWIFEFPWGVYQYIKTYLTIPPYIH
jgi:hypothetical protein